jgi:hypothetical protein
MNESTLTIIFHRKRGKVVDEMKLALEANKLLVSVITTGIGWVSFIFIIVLLRQFVITGITLAMKELILHGNETIQRQLIKHLTNRPMLLKELYGELQDMYSTKIKKGVEE